MLKQAFPFTPNGFYQGYLSRLGYRTNYAGQEEDFAAWEDSVMAAGQMSYMMGTFNPGLASTEPPQTFITGVQPDFTQGSPYSENMSY